jgi:hypothetical protein
MSDDRFTTLGEYLDKDQDSQNAETRGGLRWRMLGVMLAFVAGAFTIGYQASSTVSQAGVAQMQLKIYQLEQEQLKLRREFQVTKKREEFQTLSNRVTKGYAALAKSPSNKNLQQQVKKDEIAFATFFDTNAGQKEDSNGVPVLRVEKGETMAESEVKFDGDPTVYHAPMKVMELAKVGTFLRGKNRTASPRIVTNGGTLRKWPITTKAPFRNRKGYRESNLEKAGRVAIASLRDQTQSHSLRL